MKITQITQQVKKNNYYSIFVDGRYSFSLPELKMHQLGIKIDKQITTAELNDLKKQSLEEKAYSSCLRLISHRSRSRGELVDYLKRKQLDQELIDRVIDRLKDIGLIDDMKFAQSWVNNRVNLKHSSTLQIKTELKKKHIKDEIISIALAEAEIDEVGTIVDLIERKRSISRYQDDMTMMQFLSRRGFSYEKIKQAFTKLS